jgi:hypothetical protein
MFSKEIDSIGNDVTKDIIKKAVRYFKENNMIITKRSTRGMMITVVEYEKYQTIDNYQSTKKALRKHQESTPISKNVKNVKKDTGDFETFWSEYPNKKNKKKALLTFTRISTKQYPTILKALEQQKQSNDWIKDNGRFVPHPTTWLNGERWNDEVELDANGKVSSTSGNTISISEMDKAWNKK